MWYDMIYDMIRYMTWYDIYDILWHDMIKWWYIIYNDMIVYDIYMIWHDIWYDTIYDMIWYIYDILCYDILWHDMI